ncbi:hypothetical protein M3J09_007455 [Ascochyta lentis]
MTPGIRRRRKRPLNTTGGGSRRSTSSNKLTTQKSASKLSQSLMRCAARERAQCILKHTLPDQRPIHAGITLRNRRCLYIPHQRLQTIVRHTSQAIARRNQHQPRDEKE